MSEHTPGPWKTRQGFVSDAIEVFQPNPKIEPFKPLSLAVVESDTRQGKANARLIAAAPDLLEALEKAVKRQGFTNEELINARAAIAKAKGGTP